MAGAARRVVLGVGNEYRRDDGFGPRVLTELSTLRERDHRLLDVDLRIGDGEPTRMLDLWSGAGLAIVVDAVRAGPERAGQRIELEMPADGELPGPAAAGTHGVGLGATVALARALDRLPDRLVVLAVFGREFGFGAGLTASVEAAVAPVTRRARQLATEGPFGPTGPRRAGRR
jgi:hydrogenase maturation protease